MVRPTLIIGIFANVCITFVSCETQTEKEERLSRTHCGSCHVFTEPGLLDKRTWSERVLPQMAFRMGFNSPEIVAKISPKDLPIIMESIPRQPMVSTEEWEAIKNYFEREAPDSLIAEGTSFDNTLEQFTVFASSSFKAPFITLIRFDSVQQRFTIGTRGSKLYTVGNDLKTIDSVQLNGPPSHVVFEKDLRLVANMGIMDPNDQFRGELISLPSGATTGISLIDSLQRPVHFERLDLNGDGLQDIIVSAFGNYTGALIVFEARGDQTFLPQVLTPTPGARLTLTQDINGDGLPDILALMTQGDERLIAFINKGNMNFEETILLRFPPVYGSTYFELADFNRDGYKDILYVCGDNGDYSVMLKPYHGIKIFQNDGKNNFSEVWSFALNGASQAAARDFDKDGDLDIAAIAFFPDFRNHPEQGFVYLENTGGTTYVPHTTPMAATGRWLIMESADYDADGDTDLILGSANFRGLGFSGGPVWPKGQGSLMVFRNNAVSN